MERKNDRTAGLQGGRATEKPISCDEARVLEAAARILEKYREAFEELAK